MVQEDRTNPQAGAEASLAFKAAVADSFRQAGGAVVGSEAEMVLACFGSPLERIALGRTKRSSPYGDHIHAKGAPAARAVSFISEFIRRKGADLWYYGLDTGECTFTWSAQSGYSIYGRPAVRARILSGLASRYHAQVLVTASVNEVLPDLPAKKLDVLKERDGSGGEAFYELFLKR
jgi:class 3 adenylate cyclase